jgi:hypothetical protein
MFDLRYCCGQFHIFIGKAMTKAAQIRPALTMIAASWDSGDRRARQFACALRRMR